MMQPTNMPMNIALKRNSGYLDALRAITVTSTLRPKIRLCGAPKSGALKPPDKSVMPTLIKVIPIVVITIPVVRGVITAFKC